MRFMKFKDLLKCVFNAQKLLVRNDDTNSYIRKPNACVDDINGLYLYSDEMLEEKFYKKYLDYYVVYCSVHPLNNLDALSIHITKYEDQFEGEE